MRKVIFSLLLVFIILELGLRLTGKYRTYTEIIGNGFYTYYNESHDGWFRRNPANAEFILDHGEFQYPYTTNSLGLREREPEWLKNGQIRIATFGDSHTEGVGADYHETWPRRMIDSLNYHYPDAEMLNFGVNGADPLYSYMELKESVVPLKPSHVIFMVNHSDLDDVIYRGGWERYKDNGRTVYKKGPYFLLAYRFSHLVRFIVHNFMGYNVHLIKESEMDALTTEARDEILECLVRTDSLCRANDIRFLVGWMPSTGFACINKDHVMSIMETQFDEEYTFRSVHLTDYYRKYFWEEDDCLGAAYYWPKDGHHNAKGYHILSGLFINAIDDSYPNFWMSADTLQKSTPDSKEP